MSIGYQHVEVWRMAYYSVGDLRLVYCISTLYIVAGLEAC